MASASKETITTFRTEMVERQVQVDTVSVNLQLTENEARFIHFVLGYVGGSPIHSPRKYATSILAAIRGAGIKDPNWGRRSLEGMDPSIRFKDNKEHMYVSDALED